MFPQRLDSPLAYGIAQAMLDGFNRHYRLFRLESRRAKDRFEAADWHGQQRAQRERIEFYDLRVREAVLRLEQEFKAGEQPMEVWHQAKLHYIGLLIDHHQPECAETFFNSVTTKILHRTYFHNDFIFVRPAVSTEYIENDEPAATPTYRAYYPTHETLRANIVRIIDNFQLRRPFEDLERDAGYVLEAIGARLAHVKLRANFQIQVLSSLFFRNKGGYVVGKIINGFSELPFALPILHGRNGKLVIDACLFGEDELQMLFSFARAYFMVDMEIPAAYVQFLRSLMPRKPRGELYSALGLANQGKTLFYRDFLYHLSIRATASASRPHQGHGHAGVRPAVLPLRVQADPDCSRRRRTPRASRSNASTGWSSSTTASAACRYAEYSEVAFARTARRRLIERSAGARPPAGDHDRDGDATRVILKHLYIERRMIPLNIYLQEAFDAGEQAQVEHAVLEYGNAIKDLWRPTSSRDML